VKEIRVEDGAVLQTYKGPAAPLTSLCVAPDHSIFAGCWDKTIWHFPSSAASPPSKFSNQLAGHIDFIKCLLYTHLPDKSPILISGSADGDILFWSPASPSSRYLHRLSPQSRGIEHLALDPFSLPTAPVVFFSTSQREIYHFTLPPSLSDLKSITISPPILAHETSVYTIYFDGDGDIWTASADKTAQHLVREDGWKADTVLQHPDFVRDVVVHDRGGWAITACRDEEVRVWNCATGDLYYVFSGHFEEVTGLCLLGDTLVSVSIDATVRRWDISATALKAAVEATKNPPNIEEEELKAEKAGLGADLGLTEEEEAELRALMEDEELISLDKMALGEQ
jgi:WD40 repeat protein